MSRDPKNNLLAGSAERFRTEDGGNSSGSGEIEDDIDEGAKQIDKISAVYVNNVSETMSQRSARTSMNRGAATYADVFDEKGHPMKMKYLYISATMPHKQVDDFICYLCQEEIDPIFGYFYCFTCSIEMCRDCAVHRNKNEADMAENPIAVATNFEDIVDSASMTTRNLNASILKN